MVDEEDDAIMITKDGTVIRVRQGNQFVRQNYHGRNLNEDDGG